MVTIEAEDELVIFCRNPPDGWQISYVDTAPSTNSIAMELGCSGAAANTIIIANTQTEGRGRLGKDWQSYAGCGLYLSMILRPKIELAHLSRITLAAGVALAETTESFIAAKPMLKWPNDLYVHGQKCGGILAESDVRNSQAPLVVLGIGVNLHTPHTGYDLDLRVKAESVNTYTTHVVSRASFLEKLIPAVQDIVQDLEEGRFQDILKRWREHDYTLGKQLTWLTSGGAVVEGVCSGINDDGLLFITDGDGRTHEVLSGDIQLGGKGD
jgi:BirA family biotin operon repressor/biotin-[acetyl-CoA-carboxylase] ligase